MAFMFLLSLWCLTGLRPPKCSAWASSSPAACLLLLRVGRYEVRSPKWHITPFSFALPTLQVPLPPMPTTPRTIFSPGCQSPAKGCLISPSWATWLTSCLSGMTATPGRICPLCVLDPESGTRGPPVLGLEDPVLPELGVFLLGDPVEPL